MGLEVERKEIEEAVKAIPQGSTTKRAHQRKLLKEGIVVVRWRIECSTNACKVMRLDQDQDIAKATMYGVRESIVV
jgi:hypothetical protein